MDNKLSPYQLIHKYPPSPSTERAHPLCIDIHIPTNRILYCTCNIIVIRDLQNPTKHVRVFSEHKSITKAARFSPNGRLVCSGDKNGNVIVWSCEGENFIIKKKWDYTLLNGTIRDISWTGDSERIAVVGEGQKIFGKVFAADTGNSLGEITGVAKNLLAVSLKPNRPFKLAVGGEEFSVQLFEGPPFKFMKSQKFHTNFINSIKYAPSGDKLMTVSTDKKIIFYDGKTGEHIKEFSEKEGGHQGGIYSCDWFENSNNFVTCSGDKTVKIWDFQEGNIVKTLLPSQNLQIEHQQVGVCICKDDIYSVSLNGELNVWKNVSTIDDKSIPNEIHYGHQNKVNYLILIKKNGFLVSSDVDGKIIFWDQNNKSHICEGKKHESEIVKISLSKSEKYIYTFCNLQKLNLIHIDTLKYGEPKQVEGKSLDIQASKIDDDIVYLLQENQILIYNNFEKINSIQFQNQNTNAFDINYQDNMFAVGNSIGKVILFNEKGVIEGVLEHYGSKITSIQFSHNNKYLLCGDSQYKIRLWDLQNQKSLTENLVFHTAMIFSLKFSENDNFFISSSLDNRAIVWNTNSFEKILDLEFIHKGGINCAIFGLDKKSIYTCGGDGLINAFISEQNLFD